MCSKFHYAQVYDNYTIWKRKSQVSSKDAFYAKCPYFPHKKALTAETVRALLLTILSGSDIYVYTDVTPIMEFTLLGLSFEVLLCIALKQRKIAILR